MKFYVYCKTAGHRGLCRRLSERIRGGTDIVSLYSLGSLVQALRTPCGGERLALLCPQNEPELSGLADLADLFEGLDTIVVAPNRRKETISAAHRLRPRYLAFLDDSPRTLLAVVENIIRRSCGRESCSAIIH